MKKKFLMKLKELKNNIDIINFKVELFYLFYVLVIYFLLFVISYLFGINIANNSTWFWGGFIMLVFSIYYIEPHFTAPTNVFTNSFALFLLVSSLSTNDFGSIFLWIATLVILGLMILLSLFSKIIYNKEKSDDFIINIITNKVNSILGLFGSGKVLYSITFVYFLILNIFYQKETFSNFYLLVLFLLFCIVLVITPKNLKDFFNKYFENNYKDRSDNLGKIFSVQSENVFLVKLFDNKKIDKFSLVYFLHDTTKESDKNIAIGFLFDIYYLDNQRFGKIVKVDNIERLDVNSNKFNHNYVYKLTDYTNEKVKSFVGTINENSTVEKIYFEYSQQDNDVEIDDLLEVKIRDKKVFYQIINSKTSIEKLESYNEKGLIISEAIQVGCWSAEEMSFNKLGWVPLVNEPVYKANTEDEFGSIKKDEHGQIILLEKEMQIGTIPKTKLPSIIKLDEATSHHMAILGVTGSGKSVFARNLIDKISGIKIVVDLTSEWKRESNKDNIILINGANLSSFLTNSENKIGIIELTAMSGTGEVLQQVQKSLEIIFDHAKQKYNNNEKEKITIILEEAHTIVPETSFLGEMGDYGANKAIVNKLSQIALQGRKYGVGLIVIGQRSANISKTVLTQCNTIVAFKAFDDTSYGFLTNYFGKGIIQAIPNLKNYHAVVYGKGIKSNNPVIIDTTDENL